jgi:hypothetical protein
MPFEDLKDDGVEMGFYPSLLLSRVSSCASISFALMTREVKRSGRGKADPEDAPGYFQKDIQEIS